MKKINIAILIVVYSLTCFQAICQQQLPDQNKWYNIKLLENNEYIMTTSSAVSTSIPANGVVKVVAPNIKTNELTNDKDAFLWKFIRVGSTGNTYMIVNKKTNQYVDVLKSSNSKGAPIICHNNNGQVNQQFCLVPALDGCYYISAKSSGYVLTLNALTDGYLNKTSIVQSGLTGGKNQTLKLIEPLPDVKLKAQKLTKE